MKRFLSICLLLALISPVALLRCYVCNGSPEECEQDNEEKVCGPDQDICSSIIANVKLFGDDTVYVVKGCSKSELCVAGKASGAADDENSIEYNIECCQTDNCNAGIPSLDHREKSIPNGLTCPGCLGINENCINVARVSCVGDEDQCFNINANGRLASDSFSIDDDDGDDDDGDDNEVSLTFRGCGSQGFCDVKKEVIQTFLGSLRINETHVDCYPAKKEGDIEPVIPPLS